MGRRRCQLRRERPGPARRPRANAGCRAGQARSPRRARVQCSRRRAATRSASAARRRSPAAPAPRRAAQAQTGSAGALGAVVSHPASSCCHDQRATGFPDQPSSRHVLHHPPNPLAASRSLHATRARNPIRTRSARSRLIDCYRRAGWADIADSAGARPPPSRRDKMGDADNAVHPEKMRTARQNAAVAASGVHRYHP